MTPFEQAYARLNTEQKEAVDTIDGPVMVVAGPGTGKTQILALRIAQILRKTDTPADAILALTFTNAAAANMRERLVALIGSDAYRVSVFTFHGFAEHLIETHEDRFPELVGRSSCSDIERLDIVRALLDSARFERLKPINDSYLHVPRIIDAITHLKREGISPKEYRDWIQTREEEITSCDDLYNEKGVHKGKIKTKYSTILRHIEKEKELALLYERWEEALVARKRYDFEDMLVALIRALERDEDFLRELQEGYHYFLVDEHQDTNGAQNKILELLATFFDSPNLFVVGDEKQAVFRFQGASLANFLYFEKKFRGVRRITLSQNYRSIQGVLDVAHSLIVHNKEGIHAPLFSAKGVAQEDDGRARVCRFGAEDEELLFLAEEIKKRIASGTPAHEIAVLYRNNRDAEGIVDYFERLGIPFVVASGHGVLDDTDIRKLNFILRALADLDNSDALAKVLCIDFLGISVEDMYTLMRSAREKKESLFVALTTTQEGLVAPHVVAHVADLLKSWKVSAENESFLLTFEKVVRESGFLKHIAQSPFHVEKFDKAVRLFDEVKALTRRTPFFSVKEYDEFLRILEEHHKTLTAEARHVPHAVFLMTAHKAKGLEFDFVYVVHACDGRWGGRTRRDSFHLPSRAGNELVAEDDEEDERRLFYVALTRARKSVTITYATRDSEGRLRTPSRFVEEILPELKTEHDAEELGYADKRPPLFVVRETREGADRYRELVRSAFAERGISATALTNYLTCPWKWFFHDFLKTEFTQAPALLKGVAVHAALQDFFNARTKGVLTDKAFLLSRLTHHFARVDMPEEMRERMVRDMCEVLSGWYEKNNTSWAEHSVQELFVRVVLPEKEGDILLTGKLDKCECLDTRCHEVCVVDYKTGKPKSRNEILGETDTLKRKKGSGAYKRQLVFYKLLLERFQEGRYAMREGRIDFLEPTESGGYKSESFVIEEHEVRELEVEIRRVAHEIRSLAFWDTRCGEADCAECALREVMG